jgi:hemin uptake protein HemP
MDAETVISHDVTGPAGAEAVVQGTAVRPGQAGAGASSMPAGAGTEATDIVTAPALGPQNVDVPWVLYRHPAFGFTLRLPGHWTEWQPPYPPVFAQAPALAHIGFHDRDMVAAGTAELEPPRLLISVYANPSQQQVSAWLEVNGLLTGDEAVEPLTVAERPAVRVCSQRLIAPGCAVYIAHKGFIYRFAVMTAAEGAILAGLSFEP